MSVAPANSTLPAPPADSLAAVRAATLRRFMWGVIVAAPVLVLLLMFAPNLQLWAHPLVVTVFLLLPASLMAWRRHPSALVRSRALIGSTIVMVVVAMFDFGPFMGAGASWLIVVIATEFLLGGTAGLAVLAIYGLVAGGHLILLQAGWVSAPRNIEAAAAVSIAARTYVVCAICLVGVRFATHSLIGLLERTLAARAREQQQREAAITARHEMERTMQANQHFEALGKLAGGVAHDVNNALTVVLCSTEMLLRAEIPPDERELVHDIVTATRNAAQTTRHLLTLSRRGCANPAPVSASRVVSTVSRLATRIMPAGVTLVVEGTSERHLLVDMADLQQALLNLLLNARDAMPDGGRITLGLADLDAAPPDGPRRVRISVSDTGCGFSAETGERLFQPFFTTKAEGKGTGLGLTMVRQFVADCGGSLEWHSELGRGSRFALTFPESPAPPATEAAPPESRGADAERPSRILLVEEQPVLLALMERTLVREGFDVFPAHETSEARALLDTNGTFDLLCIAGTADMRQASGFAAEFHRRLPHQPVLLISGNVEEVFDRDRGPRPFPSALLNKPFSATELIARVRALLDRAVV